MFTQGVYYKFGRNVLLISLIRRLLGALLVGIALIFIQAFVPVNSIAAFIFLLLFLYVIIVCSSAWYEYSYHKFKLDDYALVISSGWLNKREVSIPYRQIQDVDMNTSYLEHVFGVSELFILTSATEDKGAESKGEDSSAVFPLISHVYAVELQRELMRRASIQEVTEDPDDRKNDAPAAAPVPQSSSASFSPQK